MNSFQPALCASARPEAVAMLLEIEEESEKAPKRRNIIRNKIDAAYISHAGLFGKLIRVQSDRPQMAQRSLQQRKVACSRTDHDECDDGQRASPVAASFPGGDHDGNNFCTRCSASRASRSALSRADFSFVSVRADGMASALAPAELTIGMNSRSASKR